MGWEGKEIEGLFLFFLGTLEITNPKLVLIVGGTGLAVNLLGLIMFAGSGHGHSHSHGGGGGGGGGGHGHSHGKKKKDKEEHNHGHGHGHGHGKKEEVEEKTIPPPVDLVTEPDVEEDRTVVQVSGHQFFLLILRNG